MNQHEAALRRLRTYLTDIREHAKLAGTSSGQSLDAALADVKLLLEGGSLPTVGGHVITQRGMYQSLVEVGIVRSLLTFTVLDSHFQACRELLRVEEPRRIGDVGR